MLGQIKLQLSVTYLLVAALRISIAELIKISIMVFILTCVQ